MGCAVLRLRPGRERAVRDGHPWIFSGAVENLEAVPEAGALVEIRAADGSFLAHGYANPGCGIAVRVLTTQPQIIDVGFLTRRLSEALHLRRSLLAADTDALRLVNGEGDRLPGIIVDVYGRTAVVQCLTAGAARLKPLVIEALQAVVQPQCIYERSSGAVRREEGLEPEEGLVAGTLPEMPLAICENGLPFLVDIRLGQKTGFFLDQRDNRSLVRNLAGGRDVLNTFAYTGAFSVYAAAGGARQVVSVESSPRAAQLAQRNWEANSLGAAHEWITADVFEYLRSCDRDFDLLVLDPPALVKRRREVQSGARAYKDLHLWALRRARPGALLLTFSCSQHLPADLFRKIIHGAAVDAGRTVQVLRPLAAGVDHPVLLGHPEGEYLKGWLLRAL
jgi:23S rRNA (cytosine1962-C5)-methyltransferase